MTFQYEIEFYLPKADAELCHLADLNAAWNLPSFCAAVFSSIPLISLSVESKQKERKAQKQVRVHKRIAEHADNDGSGNESLGPETYRRSSPMGTAWRYTTPPLFAHHAVVKSPHKEVN